MEEDKASDSTSSTGEDIDISATDAPHGENKMLKNEKHTKHWYVALIFYCFLIESGIKTQMLSELLLLRF